MSLTCDFNDGTRCHADADNVAIDTKTRECLAVVCEHHAQCLANDGVMRDAMWFVKQKGAKISDDVCDACAGTGKPTSGGVCMCAGTGKMSEAARLFLRPALIEGDACRTSRVRLRYTPRQWRHLRGVW